MSLFRRDLSKKKVQLKRNNLLTSFIRHVQLMSICITVMSIIGLIIMRHDMLAVGLYAAVILINVIVVFGTWLFDRKFKLE